MLYVILHFYFLCSLGCSFGHVQPWTLLTRWYCKSHAELSVTATAGENHQTCARSCRPRRCADHFWIWDLHTYNWHCAITLSKWFIFSSRSMRKNQLKIANGGCSFDKYCRPNSLVRFQRELFHFPIISKQRNSISITSFQNVPAGSGANYYGFFLWWKMALRHLNCKIWFSGKNGFLRT